jgi:hypothetical protein
MTAIPKYIDRSYQAQAQACLPKAGASQPAEGGFKSKEQTTEKIKFKSKYRSGF